MIEALRNSLFRRRGGRAGPDHCPPVTSTPAPTYGGDDESAERLPLRPPAGPPRAPARPTLAPPTRPRLALPPLIEHSVSIPPKIGERAYHDERSNGCMAWEINGNQSLCHFSAPASFYPGPQTRFVGVVEKVDGVWHHVLPPSHFSAQVQDDDQPTNSK